MDNTAVNLDWHLIEAGHCLHPEASTIRGGAWSSCEFPAWVALLRHPSRGWILFDTGYGESFLRATRSFPQSLYRSVTPLRFDRQQAVVAQLHQRGILATDVSHVVLSHLHGDHVGGVPDFPKARIWCSHEAWQDMQRRSALSALAKGLLPELMASSAARIEYLEATPVHRLDPALAPFAKGHDVLGDGSVLAVSLPGHAAGHHGICFLSQGQWVFLVADAAWSMRAIADNIPPPAWATALLGDTRQYRATLADLHALALRRTNVKLVPSHCRTLRP